MPFVSNQFNKLTPLSIPVSPFPACAFTEPTTGPLSKPASSYSSPPLKLALPISPIKKILNRLPWHLHLNNHPLPKRQNLPHIRRSVEKCIEIKEVLYDISCATSIVPIVLVKECWYVGVYSFNGNTYRNFELSCALRLWFYEFWKLFLVIFGIKFTNTPPFGSHSLKQWPLKGLYNFHETQQKQYMRCQ